MDGWPLYYVDGLDFDEADGGGLILQAWKRGAVRCYQFEWEPAILLSDANGSFHWRPAQAKEVQ